MGDYTAAAFYFPVDAQKSESKVSGRVGAGIALRFFWQLGYIIAIPLVVFTLGGRYLDRILGSTPFFIIIGLLLALISSGLWVWKLILRMKKIMD